MEGRRVMLSVLVVSMVMAQLHFQADANVSCPSTTAQNIYNVCRLTGASRATCASLSGCTVGQTTCESCWDKLTTEHDSGEGHTEYCKLGCVTSVCNLMSSRQNSDAAAVAHCTNSCSVFCAKGSPKIKALSE